jgi:hypothetical protein
MPEVTFNYTEITPNVKPYRGYDDFIHSIIIRMSATDGENTSTTAGVYELDIDCVFDENNPFVPFDQWNQEKVNTVVQQLIERAGTKERLMRKLKVMAAQPKPKQFNFG